MTVDRTAEVVVTVMVKVQESMEEEVGEPEES